MARGVKGSGKKGKKEASKKEEKTEVGAGVKVEGSAPTGDLNTRLEVLVEEMGKLFASFRDGIEALCAATKSLEETGEKLGTTSVTVTTKPAKTEKEKPAPAAKEPEPKKAEDTDGPPAENDTAAPAATNGYAEGDFVKTLWKGKEGKEFKAVFVRKNGDKAVLRWSPSKRAEVENAYADLRGKLKDSEVPADWKS